MEKPIGEGKLIARIWRASFDPSRQDELETFANERSLPYLRRQPGNLGVLYLARDGIWLTVTFWTDWTAVDVLEAREDYQALARDIEETGAIQKALSVEVFDVREFDLPRWRAS